MKELLKNYLKGEINPQQLKELRELPDSVLAESMQGDWDNYMEKPPIKTGKILGRRILYVAAAVLMIFFIASAVILWNRFDTISSQNILVSTKGNGERATVTLPDGSTVVMNSNSSLCYKPEDFTGDSRAVKFEGEGYFSVAKMSDRPFTVHTTLVDVNVKGTEFNLLSRAKAHAASLFLDSGSVEILDLSSGRSVGVVPGEFVRLDKTGGFEIDKKTERQEITSWKQGEYIYINRYLGDVVRSLEYSSGLKLNMEGTGWDEIHFTGTLPAENLLEALHILELTCGIKVRQEDNEIYVSAK